MKSSKRCGPEESITAIQTWSCLVYDQILLYGNGSLVSGLSGALCLVQGTALAHKFFGVAGTLTNKVIRLK